ncbi:MAG: DUF4124 domain-containing protein [Betaproteobacteria bacterium]|nr:DUF4124 domain-containing protein [Betaproteobacteria bacterium]
MKIAGANWVVIVALLGAGAPLIAHAQVVKCIGKDGRVEFASNCPPGTKQMDTGISSKPAPAPAKSEAKGDAKSDAKADAKGGPQTLADRDADFKKRQAAQKEADAKAEKQAAAAAERKRNCEAAQSNLVTLKNRQRMYRNDPKTGERVFFEEADFVREQANTERIIAENCK